MANSYRLLQTHPKTTAPKTVGPAKLKSTSRLVWKYSCLNSDFIFPFFLLQSLHNFFWKQPTTASSSQFHVTKYPSIHTVFHRQQQLQTDIPKKIVQVLIIMTIFIMIMMHISVVGNSTHTGSLYLSLKPKFQTLV